MLVVENGKNFRKLNGRLVNWPGRRSSDHWQLWRLPIAYIALGKRIWTLSANQTALNGAHSNTFLKFEKFYTPQASVFSNQI